MRNVIVDGLLVVLALALAVALIVVERRAAGRQGRRPRTAVLGGAVVAGVLVVVIGAAIVGVIAVQGA
ncbi:hypothetical protein GCM10025783_08440 [Amnibacterium soli]|uniref:Uncharacterized protein n=1 Tax=Amnibacterium soli TaxID=1282736 RepID=A0ABP8YUE8_9MICO